MERMVNLSHFLGDAHMTDNTKPAFGHGDPHHGGHPGMTLREYYVGQLLPYAAKAGWKTAESRAREIIDFVDTVIAELEASA